jgi:hypothetical protein
VVPRHVAVTAHKEAEADRSGIHHISFTRFGITSVLPPHKRRLKSLSNRRCEVSAIVDHQMERGRQFIDGVVFEESAQILID